MQTVAIGMKPEPKQNSERTDHAQLTKKAASKPPFLLQLIDS